MLTELVIENYRCFEHHTIPLRPTTVIVGRNNAGKSTVAEALRLISIVVERCDSLTYRDPPPWVNLPLWQRGVRPSLRDTGLDFTWVFHRYSAPPARVTAVFDSGERVTVHIKSEDDIHAVMADARGRTVTTGAQARRLGLPRVSILPQVAPVSRDEDLLTPRYVRSTMSSALAPLHFRNELYYANDLFEEFRTLAESSWPGLRVERPQLQAGARTREHTLSLLIRDGDFVAEMAAMGHGLQMWLQVMWFLTRCAGHATVILDEPDVYMHADLQRRLIRLVRPRHPQIIVATHSVEILSQVEPDELLVLDRTREASRFAVSLPGVQRAIDEIGGVHNIQITRLWSSRKLLVVEGQDLRLLKHFHDTLSPDAQEPLDAIPNLSVSGWGGWSYAVGSLMLLKNAGGQAITLYCIFDRDYHTDDEVAERFQDATKRGVQLHVWTRKEIENYLIVPEAIQRIIASSVGGAAAAPDADEIGAEIGRISEVLKDEIMDALADHYRARHRSQLPAANRAARTRLSSAWHTDDGRVSVIPGKVVLSKLSGWSQRRFGVSLSSSRIARELRPAEIAPEVKAVIVAIEAGEPLHTIP